MTTWDRDYYGREFEAFRTEYPALARHEQYELFTSSVILKEYDYETDTLETGRIGMGKDGGIDWIYFAVNGEVFSDLSDFPEERLSILNQGFRLDVLIGQAKETEGFKGQAGESLTSTFTALFSEASVGTDRLSTELVSRIDAFKEFQFSVRQKRPAVRFRIFYCTNAVREPHADVVEAFRIAEQALQGCFKLATVEATKFLGCSEMLKRLDYVPVYNSDLRYQEEADLESGKVALVSLSDYYDFLTNDDGSIKDHYFAHNIRDFEGAVTVNRQMAKTLEAGELGTDFWWLNNGVTMLVSNAPVSQRKTYTLENVQIVNGLQTSYSIFHYFSEHPERLETDPRSVMIRVISSDDEVEKLNIIKATNSQTAVSKASLRATDPIHLDIEKALELDNLRYERRKNFYRNQKYKPRDIVSITSLSQSALSALLMRPDTARARPSSFLDNDVQYREIFDDRPIEEFRWCAKIDKRVRASLDTVDFLSSQEKSNYKFYVILLMRLLGHYLSTGDGGWRVNACDNSWEPNDVQVVEATTWLHGRVQALLKTGEYTNLDVLCKSRDLLQDLERSWPTDGEELREKARSLNS